MPKPKTNLEEAERAEVIDAITRRKKTPCGVSVELFGHTGMAEWLKTGKGLGATNVAKALEWARCVIAPEDEPVPARRQVLSHFANGEPVYEWTTEPEEPAFDPQPYPEVRLRSHDEIMAALTPEPATDPAAFVLETWAAAKLTYAMETLGLTMPEGYRFRVTVEKS